MTDLPKPTVPEVLPLVYAYRDAGNQTGGHLHVVLDDGNVADYFVQACLDSCIEQADKEGERIARLLLRMSKTQRTKLCALFYG